MPTRALIRYTLSQNPRSATDWSRKCRTTRHLVDLYQQSKKGKGQHESHFTTEPEAQERDDMNVDASGGDVRMGENEDNLLDDIDVFGDLQ